MILQIPRDKFFIPRGEALRDEKCPDNIYANHVFKCFFSSAAMHTNQNVLISGDCNSVLWILNFRYWSIYYSHHLWWISKSVDVEWNSILQELEDWNFMSSSQFNSGIKYMYVFGWGTLIYHSIINSNLSF